MLQIRYYISIYGLMNPNPEFSIWVHAGVRYTVDLGAPARHRSVSEAIARQSRWSVTGIGSLRAVARYRKCLVGGLAVAR